MTDPLWVGIDLGTQSVRVQALDDGGTVVASASAPLHSSRSGDRHEQDPAEWWSATRAALRRVTSRLDDARRIRAVAVSGTSGTIVPVNSTTGRPTGSAVMYDDRRGAAELERVQSAGSALWERLGYRMQASWGLPTMLAMRAAGAVPAGSVFAHQPDVVTSRLAGTLLPSDLSSALKSGADLDEVAWPSAVFAELGLDVDSLNRIVLSGERIGAVGPAGAAETGLPVGCSIIAGMTDGCAAQIAAGALIAGSWNSVLGTTLVMKGAVDERRRDDSGAVYAHRAPFGDGWYPGGASSTGAGAFTAFLPDRDLHALTRRYDPNAPAPVAYPLSGHGERFPFVSSHAEAILPTGDDDAVFSAVLHGVAAIERMAFDLLIGVGYDTSGPVLLTGGGSRNAAWNQLRADTLGHPVSLPAHNEGAAGMAMLAAAGHRVAVGELATTRALAAVAERMTGPRTTVDPDPARHDRLMPSYIALVDELHSRGWVPDALADQARNRAT